MRRVRAALLILATLLLTEAARAEQADAAANRHFQRAMALLSAGAIDIAIEEFEEAYRIRPRYEVLHNLGLAYGLAGRPVEATTALQRYLDEGGSRIDPKRRSQVDTTLAVYRRLTGTLLVAAAPLATTLALDGKPIEKGQLVRVTAGRHVIVGTLDGFQTLVKPVDVRPETATEISLRLEPIPLPPPPKSEGLLEVRCRMPDVTVMVDDVSVAKTPLGGVLPISSGTHRVRFVRVGYVPSARDIELRPGAVTSVTCDLHAEPQLEEAESSVLRLEASEEGAEVWVDGKRYAGERLPSGRHGVVVKRAGFEPWRGEWFAAGGASEPLVVSLHRTPATLQANDDALRTRRAWGLAAGGMGMACGVVATGLVLLGSRESAAWRADPATVAGACHWRRHAGTPRARGGAQSTRGKPSAHR